MAAFVTMVYPIQIRAARILLNLSQNDLAKLASLSVVTIKRVEAAGTDFRGRAKTIVQIQRALEAAGAVFIDESQTEGPGVRLRHPIGEK